MSALNLKVCLSGLICKTETDFSFSLMLLLGKFRILPITSIGCSCGGGTSLAVELGFKDGCAVLLAEVKLRRYFDCGVLNWVWFALEDDGVGAILNETQCSVKEKLQDWLANFPRQIPKAKVKFKFQRSFKDWKRTLLSSGLGRKERDLLWCSSNGKRWIKFVLKFKWNIAVTKSNVSLVERLDVILGLSRYIPTYISKYTTNVSSCSCLAN